MASKGQVLLVDDNPDVREAIGACLEAWGYKVYYAPGGQVAKLLAQQHHPDLILLDFNMPTANGAVVFKDLQSNPETADIPVVFVTAVPLDEVVSAVPRSPIVRFLTKPIEYQKLRDCMAELMAGAQKDKKAEPPEDFPTLVDLDGTDSPS